MSPEVTQRIHLLWSELAEQLTAIEAVTFHEATEVFPPAWAIAFEGGDILLVDGLTEPDRMVFSMTLGDVRADQRLVVYETVLRVNAWLAMQVDTVGSIVLSGQQIMLKGLQRVDGMGLDQLRQIVLDLQGAVHAWRYFLHSQQPSDADLVPDQWLLERV